MRRRIFLLTTLLLTFAQDLGAHQGHPHPKVTPTNSPAQQLQHSGDTPTAPSEPVLPNVVGERYRVEVQPIFEKKCFDCHSSKTIYPWYHQVPGIRQFIDSDISEAREHIDMDPGFPFKSHATPEEDLKAISDEITSGDMPPFSYRLMHTGSALTTEEQHIVQAWVQFGLSQLKK